MVVWMLVSQYLCRRGVRHFPRGVAVDLLHLVRPFPAFVIDEESEASDGLRLPSGQSLIEF